nr:hypothetical protein [Pedobacter panaciterrae]
MDINLIPVEYETMLSTEMLMSKFGIARTTANKILWDLCEKEDVDLVPVVN